MSLGSGALRSIFVLDSNLHAHAVERSGLTFDSRFTPEIPAAGRSTVLHIVSRGSLQLIGGSTATHHGPIALLASEASVEGPFARRTLALRSSGQPFVGLDLRIESSLMLREPSPIGTLLEIDSELATAVSALAYGQLDVATSAHRFGIVRELLAERGLVRRSEREQRRLAPSKVWKALRPMAEHFYSLPTLDEVALASGRSLRQVARDLGALSGAIGLGGGWREVTRRMRLKLAVLALSAEVTSVSAVARSVGYTTADAMTRAFRDAGLPAPCDVRAAIRAGAG